MSSLKIQPRIFRSSSEILKEVTFQLNFRVYSCNGKEIFSQGRQNDKFQSWKRVLETCVKMIGSNISELVYTAYLQEIPFVRLQETLREVFRSTRVRDVLLVGSPEAEFFFPLFPNPEQIFRSTIPWGLGGRGNAVNRISLWFAFGTKIWAFGSLFDFQYNLSFVLVTEAGELQLLNSNIHYHNSCIWEVDNKEGTHASPSPPPPLSWLVFMWSVNQKRLPWISN